MAGIWRIIGKGADDSPPTISEFLHLSNANIQRINFLTSNEPSHCEEPLNPNQCRSLSSKLVRTLENIAGLFFSWDQGSTSAASTLLTGAFENFYLVSDRAKELVESCCSEDWCKASAFQIQNEEAFKDILLETSFCYSTIYELLKDKVPYQDLRQTPTFEPPPLAEVMEDRLALLRRYEDFVDRDCSLDSLVQKQHLAKHLLRRLKCVISQTEDFDVTTASSWSGGDDWGQNSEFLGGNVCKTTWLGVPCAKKVFEDGVHEEVILAEARILALVNHPNIVKFIACGHDRDNTWYFIAMEHMEASLSSVIKKRSRARKGPPFPILSAIHIMLQIAYGTCYLHDKGIAHRDFKTSNIVVRQFSAPHLRDYLHAKLVDFGLSKVKLSASRSNTISRPRIGTTVYMPPEAFQHGRANWPKADVYSFGILCSVILSGEEPFPSPKFEKRKVYEAVCRGERPMLPVETPEDLACLIKECWDSDRNVRPNFVDICTRLAQIRHKMLKADPDNRRFKIDLDSSASSYIQDRITKLSNARKQDYQEFLGNVIEEDEWFLPDEEFGIHVSHEGSNMTASHRSNSSSYDKEARESEEPTNRSWVQPGDLVGLKRQLVQLLTRNGGEMMPCKILVEYNKLFGRPLYLADYNAESLSHLVDKLKDILVIKGDGTSKTLHLAKKEFGPKSAQVMSSPIHPRMQGEAKEPITLEACSPLLVQQGDHKTNMYKPSSNRSYPLRGDKVRHVEPTTLGDSSPMVFKPSSNPSSPPRGDKVRVVPYLRKCDEAEVLSGDESEHPGPVRGSLQNQPTPWVLPDTDVFTGNNVERLSAALDECDRQREEFVSLLASVSIFNLLCEYTVETLSPVAQVNFEQCREILVELRRNGETPSDAWSSVRFCFESLAGLAQGFQLVIGLFRKCASREWYKSALELADVHPPPDMERWSQFSLAIQTCEWSLDLVELAFHALKTLFTEGRTYPVTFHWAEARGRMVLERRVYNSVLLTHCGDLERSDVEALATKLETLEGSERRKKRFYRGFSTAHEIARFLGTKLRGPTPQTGTYLPYSFWKIDPASLRSSRQYLNVEMLYRAGNGVVKDKWNTIKVAVKTVLNCDRNAFEREAAILGMVQHPNVVRLIGCEFIERSNTGLLVMELMDADLRKLIDSRLEDLPQGSCPFSPSVAVDIMLQIAQAMLYLRKHGVLHRDLKAKNILVNVHHEHCFVAKLADFGLAKYQPRTSDVVSLNAGTTRWRAPEVFDKRDDALVQHYRWPADVYSYGMTCYEVLTGKIPFDDVSTSHGGLDLQATIERGERPSLNNLSMEVPEALKDLIRWCWETNPNDRPQSFDVVVERLWQCKVQLSLPSFLQTQA